MAPQVSSESSPAAYASDRERQREVLIHIYTSNREKAHQSEAKVKSETCTSMPSTIKDSQRENENGAVESIKSASPRRNQVKQIA